MSVQNSLTYSLATVVSQSDNPESLRVMLNSLLHQDSNLDEYYFVLNGSLSDISVQLIDDFSKLISGRVLVNSFEAKESFSKCLNTIIAESRCDVIVRQDPDDVSLPIRFMEIKKIFENNSIDIVFSNSVFQEGTNLWIDRRVFHNSIDTALSKMDYFNPFIHSSVAYKRNSILEIGSYQELSFIEDFDLWQRLLKNKYTFYLNPKFLVLFNFSGVLKRRSSLKLINSEIKLFRFSLYSNKFRSIKSLFILFLRLTYILSPVAIKKLIVTTSKLELDNSLDYLNYLKILENGPIVYRKVK
jgi:amylovoran biosynthesis glycosyltransferase AmsE